MSERLSTGLRNAILDTHCFKTLMADGVIHIYSGTQPTDPDAIETGTLLMIITDLGLTFTPGVATNGLEMAAAAVAGVLAKLASETWKGTGLTAASTGTVAGWFRWYDNAVDDGVSATAIRCDGAIGNTSAYEMQMSNTMIVDGGETTITTFTYTIPQS